MSPRGKMLNGEMAESLSRQEEITILCGHYEGVDQRALDLLQAEEVTIGDYILTGGELPAMVLVDTVARFLDGVLAGEESVKEESVYSGLLEYPHYTKPREVEGLAVPEVLVSGNHEKSISGDTRNPWKSPRNGGRIFSENTWNPSLPSPRRRRKY